MFVVKRDEMHLIKNQIITSIIWAKIVQSKTKMFHVILDKMKISLIDMTQTKLP